MDKHNDIYVHRINKQRKVKEKESKGDFQKFESTV